jgi:GNAT superfamily N-acetyltransferase
MALQANQQLAQEIEQLLEKARQAGHALSPGQAMALATLSGQTPQEALATLATREVAKPGQTATLQTPASAPIGDSIQGLPPDWRYRSTLSRIDAGGKIELLDSKGVLVGEALVHRDANSRSTASLVRIIVVTGKRNAGLGSALHALLERELRALSFRSIETSPAPGFEGFYEKLGYRPDLHRAGTPWVKSLD